MTVKDLIEELQKCDQDLDVVISTIEDNATARLLECRETSYFSETVFYHDKYACVLVG